MTVRLLNVSGRPPVESAESWDVVIVGGPIYTSKHSGELLRFIDANREILADKETGFFSVSLSAAGNDSQREDALRARDCFLEGSNWQPTHTAIFAGNIAYRKYSWLLRLLMKHVIRRAGGDTDTSQNHELTNWDDVTAFARKFVDRPDATSPSGTYSDHKTMRPPSERV
jgi:menaquinone-dependent protoporphyrinogen oxidase